MPISVHLDHATDEEQLELAVGLAEKGIAFDSIMVDASHADVSLPQSSGVHRNQEPSLIDMQTDEENISIAVPWIKRCVAGESPLPRSLDEKLMTCQLALQQRLSLVD